MAGLFTSAARRHISVLLRALQPYADRLDRRFPSQLRKGGWDAAGIRAFLAVTPTACARIGSLSRFLETVDSQGRRLAKLNIAVAEVVKRLEQFGRLITPLLHGRFEPAREQLQLATRLTLNHAFYQVRESEAQAFFGLSRAEAEAKDLDDLLRRMVGVLVEAFGARAGWLLLLDERTPRKLARPMYVACGGVKARRTGCAGIAGQQGSYWSFPFGRSAVLELGFGEPHPWLPREQDLLAAAAVHCHEALERARMAAEIRRLVAEAHRAEEEERHRIGRELHDEAGQSMMLLRLQLEMIGREVPEELRSRVAEASKLAGRTAVELRRIVAALSPALLERLGLEAAIRQLVARFRKVHGAQVTVRFGLPRQRLPRQIEEVIYRVSQECLHNILKHSRATRVNLHLRAADKRIRLSVADNGAGFCADSVGGKPMSFGLAGMQERAALLGGTLAVRSAQGAGARLILDLPYPSAAVITHGKDSHSSG